MPSTSVRMNGIAYTYYPAAESPDGVPIVLLLQEKTDFINCLRSSVLKECTGSCPLQVTKRSAMARHFRTEEGWRGEAKGRIDQKRQVKRNAKSCCYSN